jgi:hypothetical protein
MFYRNSIIGILLITVGIIFFINLTNLNIKVGICCILIGYLFITFFDIKEKTNKKTFTGHQLFLILTIWSFIVFIIFYNIDADIFFIILILGIITIREFLLEYISRPLQKHMNFLFYILLIFFILVIGQKIINIITI